MEALYFCEFNCGRVADCWLYFKLDGDEMWVRICHVCGYTRAAEILQMTGGQMEEYIHGRS
jgi:hypothetical protein